MVVGVLGTVAGVYYGIQDLTDAIKKNPNPFANFFTN